MRSLTALSEQQRATAVAAVKADAVTAQIVGAWQVKDTVPSETACPDGEKLVGALVSLGFDTPQNLTWQDDAVACVDGQAQPTRFQERWRGLRSVGAEVDLPSRTVHWQPLPPADINRQPVDDQVVVSRLGPRSGPCPQRSSD